MAEIHHYLLQKGITTEKCPNTHIRQGDHSRVLISILFPGYPIIKASEQHYREMRESRTYQAKMIDLAYDRLPTTDKYERLDELFRTEVDWHHDKVSVSIPLKRLNRAAVVEGHASSDFNVRLFLYLWSSERLPWLPETLQQIAIDNEDWQALTETDQGLIRFGFHQLDITDKSPTITKANRRSTGEVRLRLAFDGLPRVRHVSVCAVWEKKPEELTAQLYAQTASLYLGQALEASSRHPAKASEVQQQAIDLLKPCGNQNDKLNLDKMETLLVACGQTFWEAWNSQSEEEEEEEEVLLEDEYVSVMDPILLSIIQHPARCIFCTHSTCFDANVFFKFQVTSMNWQCPICCVKIRGIQDLYIDYQTKVALNKYPNQDRLLKQKDNTYTTTSWIESNNGTKRTHEIITIQDEGSKRLKQI
ncbi:hypothetical protein G6F29_010035 [Rhizopus arrhizus]|nr:hypothetical protein G6F23_007246 [Rhizopus arrhizus]KAG0777957.1 hypothetical protein G6F22_011526 [Rhizopus arrhizus]KAG0786366.1 hypothetical protein G6F21_008641 [Rhizopus arrhizus]KAG0940872.1 hypothetical protein G6F32_008649 [Rhizopus arrhizus]KAG0977477.1 hypothetical protein G6F29_010035 [Rhizopus arrhizus]